KIEQNTIDSYNEAARITSEIKDTVTHHIFQSITQSEEQHLDNFRTELQNMVDYGDKYLALQSIGHSKAIAK
ncbi:MAG: bacterioferritin, partial [Alistipes sp.]|nr:bacterioferritin [Alistipes sp.]